LGGLHGCSGAELAESVLNFQLPYGQYPLSSVLLSVQKVLQSLQRVLQPFIWGASAMTRSINFNWSLRKLYVDMWQLGVRELMIVSLGIKWYLCAVYRHLGD
ncbi:hypothetical protein Ancab_039447, partial [Ancistrocladus abbreviatus]